MFFLIATCSICICQLFTLFYINIDSAPDGSAVFTSNKRYPSGTSIHPAVRRCRRREWFQWWPWPLTVEQSSGKIHREKTGLDNGKAMSNLWMFLWAIVYFIVPFWYFYQTDGGLIFLGYFCRTITIMHRPNIGGFLRSPFLVRCPQRIDQSMGMGNGSRPWCLVPWCEPNPKHPKTKQNDPHDVTWRTWSKLGVAWACPTWGIHGHTMAYLWRETPNEKPKELGVHQVQSYLDPFASR